MTKQLTIRIEDLPIVEALKPKQREFFNNWDKHPLHILHGCAGTGKTFISMYKALEDVLDKGTPYKQLIVFRSAVSSRDIGALPGDEHEKSLVYQAPYESICTALFKNPESWVRLQEQKRVFFSLTSYVRGITFDNSILLVDETQNLSYQELYSVITRIGENTKIVFCGDYKQKDLPNSGYTKFFDVLRRMKEACFYKFEIEDIVRSDLVKSFIIAEEAA